MRTTFGKLCVALEVIQSGIDRQTHKLNRTMSPAFADTEGGVKVKPFWPTVTSMKSAIVTDSWTRMESPRKTFMAKMKRK